MKMRRELLFSFVGHFVLVAAIGVIGAVRALKPNPKPQVFMVRLVNPGSTEPVKPTQPEKARVVEPKPKTVPKPEPVKKPEPEPAKKESVVRKHGLGARIEGADALGYAYYLNVVLVRIADNWIVPYDGQGKPYIVTMYFIVERDGSIHGVKVEESSGDGLYDGSAERALLVTDNLPPLPPEFTGQQLKLHLEFEYLP